MTPPTPTLHLLCGRIASGKSTLAARLAAADRTLLIAEDDWLDALYPDDIGTAADYVRCAARLRMALGPHIASVLNAGVSVVLDFPANTVETRAWMRGILDASGAAHELHLLTAPDTVLLARLRARNAAGDHPFAVTEEQFHRISGHFAAPSPDEGFNVVRHGEG